MGCGFSTPVVLQEATPVPSPTNVTSPSSDPVSTRPNDTSAASSSREEVPPTVTVTSPALTGRGGESLTVVVVHFNPSGYARRAVLVNECLQRLVQTQLRLSEQISLDITVVELCYGATPAEIDPNDFPTVKTLCCRCDPRHKMWSKEQLINLALDDQYLSMETKYVAWIDSDIAMTSDTWVEDVVACLSQHDLAFGQIWSTCDLLGPPPTTNETETAATPLMTVSSFCSQYAAGKTYTARAQDDRDYWHPGFGWMATLSALRATNGLIAQTLGSADRHMAMSFLGLAVETVPDGLGESYLDQVLTWQEAVKEQGIALVHVPGHLQHFWHGPMHRRRYMERWEILKKHQFDPATHLQLHHTGLYLWSQSCPPGLIADVADYFQQREEDSNDASGDMAMITSSAGVDSGAPGGGDFDMGAAAAATLATVITTSDPPPPAVIPSDPPPPTSDPFNFYA